MPSRSIIVQRILGGLCMITEVVVAAVLGWVVLTMAFDILIEFCIWLDETYMRGIP